VPQPQENPLDETPPPNPLPKSQRRVALQEEPLFKVRLEWMKVRDRMLCLHLLRKSNQSLLDHICGVVNNGLHEYHKLVKAGAHNPQQAMEAVRALIAPEDQQAPPPPLLQNKALSENLEQFEKWVPESRPQFGHRL